MLHAASADGRVETCSMATRSSPAPTSRQVDLKILHHGALNRGAPLDMAVGEVGMACVLRNRQLAHTLNLALVARWTSTTRTFRAPRKEWTGKDLDAVILQWRSCPASAIFLVGLQGHVTNPKCTKGWCAGGSSGAAHELKHHALRGHPLVVKDDSTIGDGRPVSRCSGSRTRLEKPETSVYLQSWRQAT